MPLGASYENAYGDMRYECSNCGLQHEFEEGAMDCCPPQMHMCSYCGNEYEHDYQAEDCHPEWECDECGWVGRGDHDCNGYGDPYAQPPTIFEYPASVRELVAKTLIYVPAIEGRPARSCSIEQEISEGAQPVARMLYDTGFSPYDQLMPYNTDADPRYAVVKSDSSLPAGGGEVVYSRFDLSRETDVRRLSDAVARIRALRQEGLVKTTTAAGTHIHVSATDINGTTIFGPAQMAALYEIFSYCEEVLFWLATAGWPGHRDAGAEYAKALRKMEKVTAGKVAQSFTHHDHRYFSLNFLRLLEAARRCSCGACISGDWEDCGCGALRKGTVEWRVFNATTKPETMHAWVLLSHGLTAAAFTHKLDTLEPNSWQLTSPDRHPGIFGWILSNCPFTDEERRVIVSCARRVESLNIDWQTFEQSHPEWAAPPSEVEFETDAVQPTVVEPPPSQYDEINITPDNYQWYAAPTGNIQYDTSTYQNTASDNDQPF